MSMKLNFRKLCARWVPKILTDEHKMKHQGNALQFLSRYEDDCDNFLSRIVTGDETWVSHVTPKSKQQSMMWRYTTSPSTKKSKRTLTTRKTA
jgi:histone-lysine N-methyltransferase SETMAR